MDIHVLGSSTVASLCAVKGWSENLPLWSKQGPTFTLDSMVTTCGDTTSSWGSGQAENPPLGLVRWLSRWACLLLWQRGHIQFLALMLAGSVTTVPGMHPGLSGVSTDIYPRSYTHDVLKWERKEKLSLIQIHKKPLPSTLHGYCKSNYSLLGAVMQRI